MEHSGMHRRLAAVLTASPVGGSDPAQGLIAPDRLRALRVELIEPTIAAHEGRIVAGPADRDSSGAMLAEFMSAAEALRCAIQIQRLLRGPGGEAGQASPLLFRIAVNLGDVIAENGSLRGPGVAIARRIEQFAVPGGICITRTVLSRVKRQVDLPLEDLGEIEVETFPEPVRVFEVLLDPDARRRRAAVPEGAAWYRQWPALVLGLAVFAFLLSAGLWLFARGPAIEPLPPPPIYGPPNDGPSIDGPHGNRP